MDWEKFKPGKKTIIITIVIACFVGCIACDPIERDVKENKKNQAKIEAAIANRDFTSARELCTKLHGPKAKTLSKINIAELNYIMDQNGVDDAYYLATELNAKRDFMLVVSKNLTKLLNVGHAQKLVVMLASWTFEKTYNLQTHYLSGIDYNDEVQEFNNVVDGIFNYAILNEDNGLAKKALKLYRPKVVEVRKNGEWQSNKLVNEAQQEAIKKAKENGIKL